MTEDQPFGPVLDLSDVVHDETISTQDDGLGSDDPPSERDVHDPIPSSPDEVNYPHSSDVTFHSFEQDFANLLQQDPLESSEPFLNESTRRRPEPARGLHHAHIESSPTSPESVLSFGLEAFLQAARVQAEEEERAAEALAAQHPELARRRREEEREKRSTRAAPAFHFLNADATAQLHPLASNLRRNSTSSQSPDYLFPEGLDSNKDATRKDATSTTAAQSQTGLAGPVLSAEDEVPDLDDILHEFPDFDKLTEEEDVDGRGSSIEPSLVNAPPDLQSDEGLPAFNQLASENAQHQSVAPPSSGGGTSSDTDSNAQKKGKGRAPEGSAQHVCEQCSKTFTRKSDVARHMRIHTGERPFTCLEPTCRKTFIQRSALQVHQRVHSGEKPHNCEYPGCGRTFGDSSSLARHRRTHTGKRPYKCEDPVCDKTFTRRTTLTAHMKTHDPTWEPDPNIKYSFKAKRPKLNSDEGSVMDIPESVMALLSASRPPLDLSGATAGPSRPLEHVASISAELAAALAHAQARIYDEDEEDADDGTGSEFDYPEGIIPNTSGIRGDELPSRAAGHVQETVVPLPLQPEDEDDEFHIPLRTRRDKEPVGIAGLKRKRP